MDLWIFIQTFFFIGVLLLLHEMGHVISAKIMNIPIERVGFNLKPIPNFNVSIKWPREKRKGFYFLFSGTLSTITIAFILLFCDFFNLESLFYAILIQLIIETNPIYSDFVIAFVYSKFNYKEKKIHKDYFYFLFQEHRYSLYWYVHLVLWVILILFIIKIVKY